MIGKTISHYKIIEEIGRGGMGMVYKAEDTKLKRTVALKFLPQELTRHPEAKKRFIHEAQAASSLDHNNICAIYEIDETDEGQLFIAMAYYEGVTLDKKIIEKPLNIKESLGIAIQIAQGLAKAHQREIVHRDIKPSNVMWTSDGVIKILDFGLAKLSTQTKLTKESTTLGTIYYMSPEQAKGVEVDYRTDIWSLGVVFYEMLTGQLPFKGEYDQAVIYGIANEDPVPLSDLRSNIPQDLERIVNRMLEKNPQDRYQHIDDLLSELKKLERDSASVTIPPRHKPTPAFKTKKKGIIPFLIILFIILIFTSYWIFRTTTQERPVSFNTFWENSVAVLPFDNLSNDPEQAYFCEGITQQILTSLSKLPDIKVISYTSVKKYQDSQKSLPQIAAELNVANILEGSVSKFGQRIRVQAQLIRANDDAHLWAEKYDYEYNIDRLFTIYDDISEKIAGSLLPNLSSGTSVKLKDIKPTDMEVYELYLKGHFYHNEFLKTGELKYFNLTEDLLHQSIRKDPNYVTALVELSDFYTTAYFWFDSSENKNEFLDKSRVYLKQVEAINPDIAMVYKIKALLYTAENDPDQAYTYFKKALLLDPNHLSTLWDFAIFYEDFGLRKNVIYYMSRAIQLAPREAMYWSIRALNYLYHLEEQEKALADFNQALTLEPENEGALQGLFWYHIRRRELSEAEADYRRYQAAYPASPNLNRFMAYLLALRGNHDEALAIQLNNYDRSFLYCYLGLNEQAIGLLKSYFDHERLVRKCSAYLQLKNNIFLKDVRNDPRFQKMMAEHKTLYDEYVMKYGDVDI